MRSILTPSSVYRNRTKLMAQLLSIRSDLTRQKDKEEIVNKAKTSKLILDFGDKEEWKEKLSPGFIKLMKLWKKRATVLMLYRSQVAGLIEQVCLPNCEYCGRNWGLKCECINNIEEVFHDFLDDCTKKGKKYDITHWNPEEWQEFFLKTVVFRTSCYSCYTELLPSPTEMNYRIDHEEDL